MQFDINQELEAYDYVDLPDEEFLSFEPDTYLDFFAEVSDLESVMDSDYRDQKFSEVDTRFHIIHPILKKLITYENGYSLRSEYPLPLVKGDKSNKRADLVVLNSNNDIMCIIECKKLNHALNDADTRQLQGYMLRSKTMSGVLTNGEHWYVYYGTYSWRFTLKELSTAEGAEKFLCTIVYGTEKYLKKLNESE
jgi:hypothetical protein